MKAVGAGAWGQQLTVTSVTLPWPSSPGQARRESPSRTAGGPPRSRECSCFRNKSALGTSPTSQQPPPAPHTAPSHPSPASPFPHAPPARPRVLPVCSSALFAHAHVCARACASCLGRTSGVHEWTRMRISVCVYLSGAFRVCSCQHAPGRRRGCVPSVSALCLGALRGEEGRRVWETPLASD